jgi:hypothetical protein
VSKETYYSVKRDLLQCQTRPTTESKETYYSNDTLYKGLFVWTFFHQKIPLIDYQGETEENVIVSKETYYSVKRDLLQTAQGQIPLIDYIIDRGLCFHKTSSLQTVQRPLSSTLALVQLLPSGQTLTRHLLGLF